MTRMSEIASKRLNFLIEKRAEYALHAYFRSGDYQGNPLLKTVIPELNKTLVTSLAYFDPTTDGKYVQWLLREYSKGRLTFSHESQEVKELIEKFEQFKGVLTKNDIYKYSIKSLQKEMSFLSSLPEEQKMSKKAFNKWFKGYLRSSSMVSVFYENLETRSKIIRLNNHQAANFYSKGTRWCISDKIAFQEYKAQGELFCIVYKKQKYLMHFYLDSDDTVASWNLEMVAEDDGHCDPISIQFLGLNESDIEFGAMVSEIMIWVALSKGVKLYDHVNKYLFPDLYGETVISLSRYLTMSQHRLKQLSSSSYSLKGYFKSWSDQFSSLLIIPRINLTPPKDELEGLVVRNSNVARFYGLDINFKDLGDKDE